MQNLAQSYEPVRPTIPLEVFISDQHVVLRRLSGFGASPGAIEGPCAIIRDLRNLKTLPYGTILVCEAALPVLLPFIPFLGGLVAERGGSLSIVSQYARAFEVPAVFGVEGVMGVIHDGDVVRLDGSWGTVDIIGQPGQETAGPMAAAWRRSV
jgi:pyruvate,water dikinase